MIPIALTPLFFAAAVIAQQVQVTAPNVSPVNVDRPFAGSVGRYQQWHSAASLQGAVMEPMRLEQMEFFAGTTPTSQAAQIDCEILVGHGKAFGATGSFDSNYDSPPVLVKPRALVPLIAGTPGQVVITVPFTTRFTWDRSRPLLWEVRVHGNNLGNAPFPYNFRGTTTSIGSVSRVYGTGSVGVASGTTLVGGGMLTRFTFRPGAVVPLGVGCMGEAGFVPVGSVVQVPSVSAMWTHHLSSAASQRPALWVVGVDNSAPFPLDLVSLLGLGTSTCLLHFSPINAIGFTTVGGGPGAGAASFAWLLPPTGGYAGLSIFTQWVVFDPLGQSGSLATTGGLWSIVAPFGG
ncbi:MAG: hypothetical protein FJ301_03640 [Planctomycetes bacterium]|nr:hypothetical protein [Planctomycetota bacterium]